MRNRLLQVILTISFLLHLTSTFSQRPNLNSGYYIVVGVYAQSREEVALSYVERIKAMGYDADYGFNENRKQYYVYLKHFDDLGSSVTEMLATRQRGVFTDAWVKAIKQAQGAETLAGQTDETTATAVTADNTASPSTPESPPGSEPPAPDNVLRQEVELAQKGEGEGEVETASSDAPGINTETSISKSDKKERALIHDNEVFLALFNATTHQPVEGSVKVIDPRSHKLIATAKGNQSLSLADYKSPSGNVIFLADVFGYRKMQRELDLKNLTNDTVRSYVEVLDTALVVFFDMVRYHKGDIVTLYNVYFHNDAAIMLPESKYELNNLVALMKENPGYKIRIHGHSNGNYFGKIVSMAPGNNFFDITGPVHEGVGSARELSKRRAETLREYLLAQEIDPERVSIKAWGGRRPMYNQNSVLAGKNIRVEVEIVDE